MTNDSGEWIMCGLNWDDPLRIRTWEELADWINQVGFLPLFKNEIPGFSVEEHTFDPHWWSGNPAQDPWEWRELIAHSGRLAYGKFFDKKAGFISKAWFPRFANWRRDGYNFDSRWDEELTSMHCKRIMDCFSVKDEWFSYECKQAAGFGKGGEKNFEGTVTNLQMQTYLIIRDFRQRVNKQGAHYGWPISVYVMPETLWGYDHIASAYEEDPAASRDAVVRQIMACFPGGSVNDIRHIVQ